MGLAASQARFLCITARKADCEYKSTALAQEKLEITNLIADVSKTYASAMNSTKLTWQNDATDCTMGVTYDLLMTPSVANDYNPYLITTKSGAVILDSAYAAAAKAAGIPKAGSLGSQESRDKFISALSGQGYITPYTSETITKHDYKVQYDNEGNIITDEKGKILFLNAVEPATDGINWNTTAGMGNKPIPKVGADEYTLRELCESEIGHSKIDWALIGRPSGEITELEYEKQLEKFDKLQDYILHGAIDKVSGQIQADAASLNTTDPKKKYLEGLAQLINAYNTVDSQGKISNIQAGNPPTYTPISIPNIDGTATIQMTQAELLIALKNQIKEDKADFINKNTTRRGIDSTGINLTTKADERNLDKSSLTVVKNGLICTNETDLKNLDVTSVIKNNIVLMTNKTSKTKEKFAKDALEIMKSLALSLGYDAENNKTISGSGLNIDAQSNAALGFAYQMIKQTFLNPNAVVKVGSDTSKDNMSSNSAYQNALTNNRICADKNETYYGVSISNMLSAFLTYYDNALYGIDSEYSVGVSTEPPMSNFVTDNPGYLFLVQQNDEKMAMNEKLADFYDQLYNNIIANGWREDDAIEDNEYLEAMVKNGTYSMMSLNMNDGYYYQSRYNQTGYIVEEIDSDAIARAEAEFASKKAELTYKEDSIDLKTKQLDAEIASISSELESVKNLISKSIEKTFAMFSN